VRHLLQRSRRRAHSERTESARDVHDWNQAIGPDLHRGLAAAFGQKIAVERIVGGFKDNRLAAVATLGIRDRLSVPFFVPRVLISADGCACCSSWHSASRHPAGQSPRADLLRERRPWCLLRYARRTSRPARRRGLGLLPDAQPRASNPGAVRSRWTERRDELRDGAHLTCPQIPCSENISVV
jgi:hypothetical protein